MPRLTSVGEFPFIAAIEKLAAERGSRAGVRIGIGDDAAVLGTTATTLATTDTLIEGVHFRRTWLTATELGRRAFRVAVSDIAAMGGKARYVLLSLALPGDYELRDARALVSALIADADGAGVALVGGNVSRAATIAATVTVLGMPTSRRLLRRSGARVGDAVYLSGRTGMAAAGIELLEHGASRGALVRAYRIPPLRLAVGAALAASGSVTAAIDVSDGLVQDLGHVARASGIAVDLDTSAIPIARALSRARLRRSPLSYALGGGDDYELLFTVRGRDKADARVARLCSEAGCMISRIGTVVAAGGSPGVRGIDEDIIDGAAGYVHFG